MGWRPDLSGERADVVGDEPVHGRRRTGRRRVPRSRHALADLEPVVLVQRVEQLRVGVVPLLARVRVRRVHVGGDRVRHHLAIGPVLGPLRDRIAQVLADDALEGLAILGAVEVPEHVVQGSVLEEHHDDVVERVRSGRWVGHASLQTTEPPDAGIVAATVVLAVPAVQPAHDPEELADRFVEPPGRLHVDLMTHAGHEDERRPGNPVVEVLSHARRSADILLPVKQQRRNLDQREHLP